jgi:pimeloyl-ACP methyl ester carboxylesterase
MLTQHNAAVIDALSTISVPAIVIVGANDKPFLNAADYMAKKIPGAEKVIIPDAGHAVNLDQPATFNAAVLDFLDQLR